MQHQNISVWVWLSSAFKNIDIRLFPLSWLTASLLWLCFVLLCFSTYSLQESKTVSSRLHGTGSGAEQRDFSHFSLPFPVPIEMGMVEETTHLGGMATQDRNPSSCPFFLNTSDLGTFYNSPSRLDPTRLLLIMTLQQCSQTLVYIKTPGGLLKTQITATCLPEFLIQLVWSRVWNAFLTSSQGMMDDDTMGLGGWPQFENHLGIIPQWGLIESPGNFMEANDHVKTTRHMFLSLWQKEIHLLSDAEFGNRGRLNQGRFGLGIEVDPEVWTKTSGGNEPWNHSLGLEPDDLCLNSCLVLTLQPWTSSLHIFKLWFLHL